MSFNSSGTKLAWVGHDSTIMVADSTKGLSAKAVSVMRTDFLPFLSCLWVSDNALVAAVSLMRKKSGIEYLSLI